MEHGCESGVQFCVGVEMEAMVIKQQLKVTKFAISLGRSQPNDYQH